MKRSHANWVRENCNEIMGEYVSKSFIEGFHEYLVNRFTKEELKKAEDFWKLPYIKTNK